ncbi:helix-turn-helix domain-containing protein [Agrobacterium tumefaciens]|uniref:helix-turn-helix domain-containing protein n=1 Tax=Agrobacterium tumefaciens TaxID=358 RepID=UPI000DD5139A
MFDLKTLRNGAALTQAEFAEAMGVPLRTYENLESGSTPTRPVHLNAAYWGLIKLAHQSGRGLGFLPFEIGEIVRKVASSS